jgi:hypothetical protein
LLAEAGSARTDTCSALRFYVGQELLCRLQVSMPQAE